MLWFAPRPSSIMRVRALKSLKLAMYTGLCVCTAAAHARPRLVVTQAHAHSPSKTHAVAASGRKSTAAPATTHGRHAENAAPKAHGKHALMAEVVVPVHGRRKRGQPEEVETPAKGRGTRSKLEPVAAVRHDKVHGHAIPEPAHATAAHAGARGWHAAAAEEKEERLAPRAARPTETAEAAPAPETPEPNVHHNRKVHHEASSAPESSDSGSSLSPALGPVQPIAFRKGGRVHMPPAMKGSHEILIHQNQMADEEGLERVQDDADLDRMRAHRELVPIPVSGSLVVDDRLPEDRRFTRPWVAAFLTAAARAHAVRFGGALQVNSAVRTVEFQVRLIRTNGNAAPAAGDTASPHLTGQAVDIAKHGLSAAEIGWMREYLMPLVDAGKIDVEEEFQQACFHISVYRSYAPGSVQPKQTPAPLARFPTVLAAATALP